jgi:phage baseplate assembly protein W
MRPTFGSGVLQLVFSAASPEVAATTQFLIQGALQQWLGDVITVDTVDVEAQDSALLITVQYVERRTQTRGVAQIIAPGAAP